MRARPYWQTFKEILSFLPSGFSGEYALVCLLSLLLAAVELTLTVLVSFLGIALAAPQTFLGRPGLTGLSREVPLLGWALQDQTTLCASILAALAVTVFLKLTANVLINGRRARVSRKASRLLGLRLLSAYLNAPYVWHVNQDVTRLVTTLNWRGHVSAFLQNSLLAVTSACTGLFLLVSLLIGAPGVGLWVLGVTGSCSALTYALLRGKIHTIHNETMELEKGGGRILWPALQGIREVAIYRQQNAFLNLFTENQVRLDVLRTRLAVLTPLPPWVLEAAAVSVLLFSFLFMALHKAYGPAELVGTLALLAAVAWRMTPALNRFVGALVGLQSALPYVRDLLREIRSTESLTAGTVKAEPCPLERSVTFKNVSFDYPSPRKCGRDTLRNLSFSIAKGECVGFAGVPGSGKSTLIGLLSGLFSEKSGEILVDGVPLTPATRAGWTGGIGYVPQSPFLLNDTLAKNVAFSRWGQQVDEDRVLRCVRLSAMDFLQDLPDGMHTVIGERGVRLSGGQTQHVAIARALYEDPQLLIFDEATNSLDEASEALLLKTINRLRDHMTIVIISHRLTALERCDTIYWLDNGEIVMHGPSSEVLCAYRAFLQSRVDTCHT